MRKTRPLLLFVFIASIVLTATNFYTIKILSAVRAYINGESEYSKGQKDALIYLTTYMQTEDPAFWTAFKGAINIPIGDNLARERLNANEPDKSIEAGFLAGKNHKDDIPGMIWLFKTFRSVSFMKAAIDIWSDAEPLINKLDEIGNDLHTKIEKKELTPQLREASVQQISIISSELSIKESAFSETLGNAARKINIYLLIVNIFSIVFILGNIVLFAMIMIRRISRSENELKIRNVELGNTNTELDTLLHSISHDLRSPITSMKGLVQLMNEEGNPKRLKEYLVLMDTVVDKQNNFISDTIDFFKNRHTPTALKEVNVADIIDEVIITNKFAQSAHDINIKQEIGIDKILSDEVRLKMIINNLVSNAIKYSDEDKQNKVITVKTNKADNWFDIEVEDNGIGMDNAYLEKIFDMFYVIPGNRKGTGLGLYILKQNVEKLSGKIQVQSAIAHGTKFTVSLPCV